MLCFIVRRQRRCDELLSLSFFRKTRKAVALKCSHCILNRRKAQAIKDARCVIYEEDCAGIGFCILINESPILLEHFNNLKPIFSTVNFYLLVIMHGYETSPV